MIGSEWRARACVRRLLAWSALPAASAAAAWASQVVGPLLEGLVLGLEPFGLGLVPRDARVEPGELGGGQVGLGLQLLLRGDLELGLDQRG